MDRIQKHPQPEAVLIDISFTQLMFRENRIKKHDSKQEHMSVARFLEFKYIYKETAIQRGG